MKKTLILVAVILAIAALATAQTPASTPSTPLVDHWATSEECLAADANTPYYYPTIVTQKKLTANEVVYGLPFSSCVEMALPDRSGKRGFVQIESGRAFVYNKTTGKPLRLKECNNEVFSVVPFPNSTPAPPANGIDGKDGTNGKDGRDGTNYIPAQPVVIKKHSRCGKKCALVIGFVAAAAVGGTYVATHKGQPAAIPTTPTPPTGSLLPIVTTLPPGGGH